MRIKKGEPLYSIYSQEISAIQNEIQIAKELNNNIFLSAISKLDNLDISKENQKRIKEEKISDKGIVINSPVNGILIQKNINNKSFIKKDTTLLQLADLNQIWFIASIYQEDLVFIQKDNIATVYIDGLNTSLNTKVDFIYPIVDEKTKTVNVRFILDNKNLNLIPSMFGKVQINILKEQKLTLPKTAVLKKSDEYYVFKPVSKDEFEPVKINAKRISSNKYEIISGLKEDDEVINNALFLFDSDALTNNLYESDKEDW